MLTTDLIKKLQDMVEAHKSYEEVMGPHEIVIDCFRLKEIECKEGKMQRVFAYAGFTPDVRIEKSRDGVYDILSGFVE